MIFLTSNSLPDISPLLLALTAYVCCDVSGFKTSLDEIDRVYDPTSTPDKPSSIRRSLCEALVDRAIKEGNLDMLPPLLQEKGLQQHPFGKHAFVIILNHDGSNVPNGAEVVRLVREAGYILPETKEAMNMARCQVGWP